MPQQSHSRRGGMTLLELILALFIASLVMMAIGMAMQLQVVALESRRNVVEEVQLARAIMRQISDDLRSAARYEELTVSDSSQALDTGSTESSTSSTGSAEDQANAAVSNLDMENSTSTTAIPGVLGNQYQLQVDVSRLPRIDEYQPMLSATPGGMMSVPSGFRTVGYYIGTQTDPTTGAQVTGLIRRELDRTITDYAQQSGNIASINTQGELLASEVVAIEFRYFDGQQYLLEWDTAAKTALPIAVEVAIWLKSPVSGRDSTARDETSTPYRVVVALPTGEYPADASTLSTTGEESTSGQPSSSSSTGSTGASGGGAMGGGAAGGGGTGGGAGGS